MTPILLALYGAHIFGQKKRGVWRFGILIVTNFTARKPVLYYICITIIIHRQLPYCGILYKKRLENVESPTFRFAEILNANIPLPYPT